MSESPVDVRRDASSLAAPAERPRGTVLQVLPALETGGVERGTVEIARALTTAGWGAVVASSGGALVADIQRAAARLRSRGATFARDLHLVNRDDDSLIGPAGGEERMAPCRDPGGNLLAITARVDARS